MTEKVKQPVVLVLADGFGINPNWQGNAVTTANPANFFGLWKNYRHLVIQSTAQEGGSPYSAYTELSTGRKVDASYKTVKLSAEVLSSNNKLLSVFDSLKRNNASLHLFGNIGAIGQDDELANLLEIVKFAKTNSIIGTFIHLVIDNSIDNAAMINKFLTQLESELGRIDYGHIASVTGINQIKGNNYKEIFQVLFTGRGKTYLSAKQIFSNLKNSKPADIMPSLIQSRQNQRISSFDLLFFFSSFSDELSDLLREIIINNRDGLNPGSAAFLEFFAVAEFPFDIPDKINFLFHKNPGHYLSDLLHSEKLSQALVTDQSNSANLNYYFLGTSQFVDLKIVQDEIDSKSKNTISSTKRIADLALAEIAKNDYDLVVVNFPSLYRFCLQNSFKKCVEEIKLLDVQLGAIVKKVLSLDGYLFFCPAFGGAESISGANDAHSLTQRNAKSTTLPFIIISDMTKFNSKSDLFHEILQSQADLTTVLEALKIILLEPV